jgi:hypothetical protein
MIMKKLIAIAVVFALVAGGVFAADLSASVFGNVTLFSGDTTEKADGAAKIFGGAGMERIRLEGSGEPNENFGAWYRLDGAHWSGNPQFEGLAWWKPIDQFKLAIGGNSDGLYAKEGFSGWMFHQIANESGVVVADQAWGAAYAVNGENFRQAFYGGFGGKALMLEIKPVDMFGLNVILPYFDFGGGKAEGEGLGEVFKNMTIQADVNMDFGNIALTFALAPWSYEKKNDKIGGKIFLFFGLTAVDNLDFAFSAGIGLPKKAYDSVADEEVTVMDPIAIGIAAKYSVSDQFWLKARVMAKFGGKSAWSVATEWTDEDDNTVNIKPDDMEGWEESDWMTGAGDNPFGLIFDIQPSYAINDSVTVSADIGINMLAPKGGDSVIGFHFNPYVQVGQEWGPSFLAGFQVYTKGKAGDKTPIYFALPIGLEVSF